ncbi:MAG: hypothetical protein ACE5FJ_04245, partial [Gemmatimonadales bacterium]
MKTSHEGSEAVTENPDATAVKQLAFGDLELELGRTRQMLERVPEEHFSWKPHERSYSLKELAAHLANLPFWLI